MMIIDNNDDNGSNSYITVMLNITTNTQPATLYNVYSELIIYYNITCIATCYSILCYIILSKLH